ANPTSSWPRSERSCTPHETTGNCRDAKPSSTDSTSSGATDVRTKYPRRDSNPHLRVEGPASSAFDHGGKAKLRRQDSNLRLAINSRAQKQAWRRQSSHHLLTASTAPPRPLDHTGTNGGSRIRTCGRAPHAYALAM